MNTEYLESEWEGGQNLRRVVESAERKGCCRDFEVQELARGFEHGSISLATAGSGFTVAVALYLGGVWLCHDGILDHIRVESRTSRVPGTATAKCMEAEDEIVADATSGSAEQS